MDEPDNFDTNKNNDETQDEFILLAERLITKSQVTWDDIGGLDETINHILKIIIKTGINPHDAEFSNEEILLFGPPGTGKTLIAAAIAGSLHMTFFNFMLSNVLSKYHGESEKIITSVFNAARKHAPSVIFIDEFDGFVLSSCHETNESSQKVLQRILLEFNKIKETDQFILIIAATSAPWVIDDISLSSFKNRIYVPLPDKRACQEIIKLQTKGLDISQLDLDIISEKCTSLNFSAREIQNICQSAIRSMIRENNKDLHTLSELPHETLQQNNLVSRQLSSVG